MKQIIENATIFYKNGTRQICDAIEITKKGVYTGHIIIKHGQEDVFEDHGFIPLDQIEKIIVFKEQGKTEDIDFKDKGGKEEKTIGREGKLAE